VVYPVLTLNVLNMSIIPRKILVSTALPYANGSIHIGHMLEHIQTDIWVRFQRLRGHEIYFVCADDAHGTPIMLKAKAEGISPEELIAGVAVEHTRDFNDFSISFDNYYTTHSPENRELAESIFNALNAAGHIVKRTISQAFDPVEKIFLPDRFIKGSCPRCAAPDQYGDNCENCGATYSPSDLVNPYSALSGATPIEKDTEHYFFALGHFESMLKQWTAGGHIQSEVHNKLKEWFDAGLRDWDISRDAPYFGFNIPGETDKFFYVWLDAPIGYFASFKNYCVSNNIDFEAFIANGADTEMYHFIGKDILYFHTLFWPAMLEGAGLKKPTAVYAHGFLTVNGLKMSKSRGTFISAREYLNHLSPDYLRYYFAAKLNDRVEDLDLNLEDFVARVNADLVGKVVNIASRCAGFLNKRFDNTLSAEHDNSALLTSFAAQSETVAQYFEDRQFSKAIRLITELADQANQYVNDRQPWVLAKNADHNEELHQICSTGINLFRILMCYLSPVLPDLSNRVEKFLQSSITHPNAWQDISTPLVDHQMVSFKHLLKRIESKDVDAMVAASTETQDTQKTGDLPTNIPALDSELITIDDFAKVDLRIARIVAAQRVDGSDKLLQLTLDIGHEQRNVFAGISSAYEPEQLVGRLTAMVANLAPRKMRFGISEGMVMATGPGGKELWILSPDDGAQPGMRIK